MTLKYTSYFCYKYVANIKKIFEINKCFQIIFFVESNNFHETIYNKVY
jgi:hypothetical protein